MAYQDQLTNVLFNHDVCNPSNQDGFSSENSNPPQWDGFTPKSQSQRRGGVCPNSPLDTPIVKDMVSICCVIYALKTIPRDIPSGLIGSTRLISSAHVEIKKTRRRKDVYCSDQSVKHTISD